MVVSSGYGPEPVVANCSAYGFKAVLPNLSNPEYLSQVLGQVPGCPAVAQESSPPPAGAGSARVNLSPL